MIVNSIIKSKIFIFLIFSLIKKKIHKNKKIFSKINQKLYIINLNFLFNLLVKNFQIYFLTMNHIKRLKEY
jgi:hypothetical protein